MEEVRSPAVAGRFYPRDPKQLESEIRSLLLEAATNPHPGSEARALVAPHAGYIYSGPIAASAFCTLQKGVYERVVVAGPSHFVGFEGVAVPPHKAFATPLGTIPLDGTILDHLLTLPDVFEDAAPHELEHSIEVELPWLQVVLGEFRLVPLSCGVLNPESMARVLEAALLDGKALLVVSTDLSHYLDRERARLRDRKTAQAILELKPERIGTNDACGAVPLRGLLALARRRGWRAWELDLRNSADTAGDPDRVVGYGAFLFG